MKSILKIVPLISLLIFTSVSTLLPSIAHADTIPTLGTANQTAIPTPQGGSIAYVDAATINLQTDFNSPDSEGRLVEFSFNGSFVDTDIYDGIHSYKLTQDGCTSSINLPGSSYSNYDETDATVDLSAKDPYTLVCNYVQFKTTVGNVAGGATMFAWASPTEVDLIQGGFKLGQNSSNQQQFVGNTTSNFIQVCTSIRNDQDLYSCKPSCTITLTVNSDDVNGNASIVCKGAIKYDTDQHKTETFSHVVISGSPTQPTAPVATDESAGTAPDLSCSAGINPLNWLLCGVVDGLTKIVSGVDSLITSQLSIGTSGNSDDPTGIFGTSGTASDYYQSWSYFRDLSLGLMVVVGLIVILSQALGFEILDAYTIRKVLPRLVAVAIGITLSWELMEFMVKFTNDLGFGVRSLIYAPFSNLSDHVNLGGGQGLAATIATAVAERSFGIFGLLSFVGTAAIAVFVAFLVLVIRQIVVTVLILTAPLALVAYILPNTQKIYKIWWDSFSKALMMFPIIAGFIASGRVFSAVALQPNSSGGAPGIFNQFIGFAAYFAPYFLLPLTFRFAGGALANIGGFVNDRHRGAFDGLKNFRGNQVKQRRAHAMERAKTGNVFKGAPEGTRRARLNNTVQGATLLGKAGVRPSKMAGRLEAARGAATLAHMKELSERSDAFKAFSANDTLINAANHGRGAEADWRTYLQGQGQSGKDLDISLGLIRAAKRDMGESFGIASSIANTGTGTGFGAVFDAQGNLVGGGAGAMLESVSRASNGNSIVAGAALGQSKSRAEQARRYDLSGAGYGDLINQMGAIDRAQGDGAKLQAQLTATSFLADRALETNGPGAMLGGRGNSVQMLVPAMQRRIQRAQEAVRITPVGSQDREVADRNFRQVMASSAGLLDTAAQASPENQKMLADGLMQLNIMDHENGVQGTFAEHIEANRNNPEFMQMRREYERGFQQDYEAANRRGITIEQGTILPPINPIS